MADASEKREAGPFAGQEPAKPDPPGYFPGESMTRRRAFTVAAQAIGGVAAAAVALPAIGFAIAPIFHRGKERWEAVGQVDDFTADTYKQVVFTLVPGIGEAGKTTAFVRRGTKQLQEDPNVYIAISSRCAHVGCPVRFVQASGKLHLPLPRRRL